MPIVRDHTNLRAFEMADEVALLVDQVTAGFPRKEISGLVPSVFSLQSSTFSPQSPA